MSGGYPKKTRHRGILCRAGGASKDARGDTIDRSSLLVAKGREARPSISPGEFHGIWTMRLSINRTRSSRDGSLPEKNIFATKKSPPSEEGEGTSGQDLTGIWVNGCVGENPRQSGGATGAILMYRSRPGFPRMLYRNFSAGSSGRPTAGNRSPRLPSGARNCGVQHWDPWRDRRA